MPNDLNLSIYCCQSASDKPQLRSSDYNTKLGPQLGGHWVTFFLTFLQVYIFAKCILNWILVLISPFDFFLWNKFHRQYTCLRDFSFYSFVCRLNYIKNRRRIKRMSTWQCVARRMRASAAVHSGIRRLVHKAMPAIASVLWQTGDFVGLGVSLIRGGMT